jgi:apolipoprotein N-acyltransferase
MVQSFAAPSVTRYALALLAGLLQAWSVATPWGGQPAWWLQMASLAALVALLRHAPSVRAAALLGWLFALSWLTGSVWWLFISMHTFGGLPAPLAALAVLALCGFLALYYAAACAVYQRFSALVQVSTAQAAIIFAAVWLLAELARDTWFTGFPWAAGGYAHVDGPLAALAWLVGQYGIVFVAAVFASYLARLISRQRAPRTLADIGLGLVMLSMLAGWVVQSIKPTAAQEIAGSASAGRVSVALLQGNIPQGEKFDSSKGIPIALDWYAQQLSQATATLVVAPETAIPLLPQQLPDNYWAALQQRFQTGQQAALVGIPLGTYEQGYTNSVIGLSPPAKLPGEVNGMQPQPYRYDKHHLVPFGEFTPTFFKWFTRMMNIPLGDFNRGAVGQDSFNWAGQRWAPNICYEDLFGDELAARFKDASTAPTVLVNISNIGWFGNSIAIDQHLHISRMRALEFGRPMLRATNTGPTVIIDHTGRVTYSLPRHTRGTLVGEVQGRTGITPYAWWAARLGLWPLWLLGVGVLAVTWLRRKKS